MRSNIACAVFSFVLAVALHAQSRPTAISAAKIHIGDGTVIENGMIIIHEGKIVAAGAGVAIPADADAVAYPGCEITPGFVDAAALPLGEVLAEHVSEVTPEFKMLDAIDLTGRDMERLAREGVTTVFVSGDNASVIGARATVVKTGGSATNRVLVPAGAVKAAFTQEPENRGFGNSTPFGRGPVSLDVRRPTTQMGTVFVFRDAMQIAANARDARAVGAPTKSDASTAVLIEMLDGKRPMRIAATALHEIEMAIRASREFGFSFTIEEATEIWRALDMVKAVKSPVVYGPVVEPPAGNRGRFFGRGAEPAIRRLATPKMLLEKGIPFSITARGGRGDHGLARQAMHAMKNGLSREQAITAVTKTAAELSGVADRVGQIKVGLDADLIVWSGAPLEATSLQSTVYLNGVKVAGDVH